MSAPFHLVTDMPLKAYNPRVVEAWAHEHLGVTDEAKIAGILDLYKQWDASQRHEVMAAAKGGNQLADLVLVLSKGGEESEEEYRFVIPVSHSNPDMTFRKQRMGTERLCGMDALELGSFILDPAFEYTPEKRMGEYVYLNSLTTQDSFEDIFRHARENAVSAIPDRFFNSVAIYLGEADQVDRNFYDLPRIRQNDYMALEKHLNAVATEKADLAIAKFKAALDQDALRVMAKANYADRNAYTWLTGRMPERYGDEKSKWMETCASPDALRRRRQALEAVPALVWWFVGYDRVQRAITDTLDNDGTLLQAINAGLAEYHEDRNTPPPTITQEFLSWFGQFDVTYIDGPRMMANPEYYHFGRHLPLLQAIPREWRPKTHEELQIFMGIRHALSSTARVTGREVHKVLVEFMSACRNPAGLPKSILDLDLLRISFLVKAVEGTYGERDMIYGDRKLSDQGVAKLKITHTLLNAMPAPWLPKSPEDARKLAALCAAKEAELLQEDSHKSQPPLLYKKLAEMLGTYADKFDAQSKKVMGIKTDKTGLMYHVLANVKERNAIALGDLDSDFYTHIGSQIILTEIFRQATANGYTVAEITADEKLDEILPTNWGLGGDAARTIFAGMTAVKVKSLTDRWHAREARLHTRNARYSKSAVWEPLFEKMEHKGVVYECLTSTEALTKEADEMGHCVRGYTPNCVIKNSHIITLRAKNGAWRATLEVTEEKGGGARRKIRHVQLEGPNQVRNDHLPVVQQAAAQWIIDHINQNSAQVNWKAIDERRAVYRTDELLMRIGFNFEDTKACDDAYEVWRANFRDIFKEPTREAFLQNRGITEMIQKKFPPRRPKVA